MSTTQPFLTCPLTLDSPCCTGLHAQHIPGVFAVADAANGVGLLLGKARADFSHRTLASVLAHVGDGWKEGLKNQKTMFTLCAERVYVCVITADYSWNTNTPETFHWCPPRSAPRFQSNGSPWTPPTDVPPPRRQHAALSDPPMKRRGGTAVWVRLYRWGGHRSHSSRLDLSLPGGHFLSCHHLISTVSQINKQHKTDLVGAHDEHDAVHISLRAHFLFHLPQPAVEGIKTLPQAHVVNQQDPLTVLVEFVPHLRGKSEWGTIPIM